MEGLLTKDKRPSQNRQIPRWLCEQVTRRLQDFPIGLESDPLTGSWYGLYIELVELGSDIPYIRR
jgi:hypothetical protein